MWNQVCCKKGLSLPSTHGIAPASKMHLSQPESATRGGMSCNWLMSIRQVYPNFALYVLQTQNMIQVIAIKHIVLVTKDGGAGAGWKG